MSFKKSDITFHRSVDNSDPGFAVKGHTLRWVSGGVEARRAPRMWKPVKVSGLDKDVVAKLEVNLGNMIDGDRIRRRDLILHFAPEKEVAERRKRVDEDRKLNEEVFKANSGSQEHGAIRTTKDTGMTRERVSSGDFK